MLRALSRSAPPKNPRIGSIQRTGTHHQGRKRGLFSRVWKHSKLLSSTLADRSRSAGNISSDTDNPHNIHETVIEPRQTLLIPAKVDGHRPNRRGRSEGAARDA